MKHTTDQVRIVLDVDVDTGADPIQGCLSGQSRSRRRFYGWLELAGAIEAARTDSRGVPATAISDEDPGR